MGTCVQHVIKKFIVFVIKLCVSLGIVSLILSFFFAWRLHHAPLDITFAQHHLEKNYPNIKPKHMSLIWKNLYEEPEIILEDTQINLPNWTISAPHISINLSLINLALGQAVYDRVSFINPYIRYAPEKEGSSPTESMLSGNALTTFFHAINNSDALQKTTVPLIEIHNAQITSDSHDCALHSADIVLNRRLGNLHINFDLSVKNHDGAFSMYGHIERVNAYQNTLRITVDKVPANLLQSLPIEAHYIDGIDGTLSSTLSMTLEKTQKGFGCEAKNELHYCTEKRCVPLNSKIALVLQSGCLYYDIQTTIKDLKKQDIIKAWPHSLNIETRRWIQTRFDQAVIPHARICIKGHVTQEENSLPPCLSGNFEINNTTLKFLDGLPAVTDCSAEAAFNNNQFLFSNVQGHIQNTTVNTGQIHITNLNTPQPKASINLSLSGSAQDAFEYIQHAPLTYDKKFNMHMTNITGDATATLAFSLPLKEKLVDDDIISNISLDLKKTGFTQILHGEKIEIKNGDFNLTATPHALNLKGTSQINGVNATITWEAPKKTASYRNKYHLMLNGPVTDIPIIHNLLEQEMFEGPLTLSCDLTELDQNNQQLVLTAKLEHLDIHIPQIGWHKAPSIPGSFHATFLLKNYKFRKMRNLILESKNVDIQGNATFQDNTICAWDFKKIQLDKTHMSASAHMDSKKKWHIHMEGPKLSVKHYIKNTDNPFNITSDSNSFFVSAKIDRVFLEKGVILHEFSLSAHKSPTEWVRFSLEGNFSATEYMRSRIQNTQQNKVLTITSNNIGLLLKGLSISEDYVQGKINLRMLRPLHTSVAPYVGEIILQGLRIVDAPAAYTFDKNRPKKNVIIERGTHFDTGRAELYYNDGQLIIQKGLMHNNSTGITAEGCIDIQNGTMYMKGAVVPAFMINQMLAHIPIIGTLLSGGDENNGIVSLNFTLKGLLKDYDLKINPFSAFAPGFVKQAFKSQTTFSHHHAHDDIRPS